MLGLLAPSPVLSQGISLQGEYQKKIKAAGDLGALGEGLFGNQTSESTGKTVFSNVDIDIPGNSALPVRFERRLPIEPRYMSEELGGLGNWDIDVPYIEGTFSKYYGWSVPAANSADRVKRCSLPNWPLVEGVVFSPTDVFHGYNIHVPGVLDDILLKETNGYVDPLDGQAYPWIVKSMARLSCLPVLKNGGTGEGFVLKLMDGTRYYFDYPVERYAPVLRRGPKTLLSYNMERKRIFLLATRIEDRFGNYVDYQYSGGNLTAIVSSDGRRIDVVRQAQSVAVSANGRSWNYQFQNGYLVSVVNPDGSKWQYTPFGSFSGRSDYDGNGVGLNDFSADDACQAPPQLGDYFGARSFIVTHPSGASGIFTFTGEQFPRSRVPYRCYIDFFDHQVRVAEGASSSLTASAIDWNRVFELYLQGSDIGSAIRSAMIEYETNGGISESYVDVSGHAHIGIPNNFPVLSLTSIARSGPGVAAETTNYAYLNEWVPYCDQIDGLTGQYTGPRCNEDPCPSAGCSDGVGRWVEVTRPSGVRIRSRFGIVYGQNEGQLLARQILDASGGIVRSETFTYFDESNIAGQNFSGTMGIAFTPDPIQGLQRPRISSELVEGGVTYTTATPLCTGGNVFCFDAFARPIKLVKSNSLGAMRTDVVEYYDDLNLWILGQHKRGYSIETGMIDSEITYNAMALPWKVYRFGKLQQTLTYNADGTLATAADGAGNTTTYSSWKSGIPQSIVNPDATTQSATVDDNGWITSVTDENGYVTGYGYDAMGRMASIVQPTGDTLTGGATTYHSTWANYRALTDTDWKPAGVSTGQWRKLEGTGDHIAVTYYDALWRPVLTNEYDQNNVASTLRAVRTEYDTSGRKSFESYPASVTVPGATGIRTFYDALDRVTRVEQDSELGVLATTTEYLTGLKTRVTNPRGQQTTTSFIAWGQPSYDLPILSEQPEGKVIQIGRHPQFGWPLSMTQRNAANTLSQTRRYVYDGNAQLCKTIEPETGATVTGYDAAGNPSWSAAGLDATAFGSTSDCQHTAAYASGRVSNRTYDARNRLSQLSFPDGRGNQIWTYTSDGKPASVTAYNGPGNTLPVVMAYTYNHRRLLTGESVSQTGSYTWTIGNAYDAYGNLASQTYPTGLTVDYAPNPLGQATKAGPYATGAQYYPNGALKQFTYGNGIVHSMTQNLRQLPSRVTSSGGVTDFGYTYDANANIAAIADYARGSGYDRAMSYDGLDRLLTTASPMFGGTDQTHRYTYDALDNLKSWKLAGVKDYADYVYDAQNRLTNIRNTANATVVGLGYDLQGNVINKNGQGYDFDYGNRLRTVTSKESYRYDGLGRRVQTTATDGSKTTLWQYTQAGQMLFSSDWEGATYANQKTHENVYLAGSIVATIDHSWPSNAVIATKYQHTDALGSPVAVTNTAGAVTERNDYEPYGAVIGKPTYSGIGYTGHVMDGGTGLTYMQQRYYDQSLGRFLSVDPVAAYEKPLSNQNRYWYGNDNPYKFFDPDGRQSLFGSSEIDFGPQYVGRIDAIPQSDIYEIHVYRRGQDLIDAVSNGDTKGLRKQEIGIVGPDGNWIAKHGHDKAPMIGPTANNKIRGEVAIQARRRGWLGEKGTVDIRGVGRLERAIQQGMESRGSLKYLKALGKSLGAATVVAGYLDNISQERLCSIDPDFETC